MFGNEDEILALGGDTIGPYPEPEITIRECYEEYDTSFIDYEYMSLDKDCCQCEDCEHNLFTEWTYLDVLSYVLTRQIKVNNKQYTELRAAYENLELRAKYEALLQQATFSPKFTMRPARVQELPDTRVDSGNFTRNERRNCSCSFCKLEVWIINAVKVKDALRLEVRRTRAEYHELLHEYNTLRKTITGNYEYETLREFVVASDA
ncbi:hypothetical protein EYC80_005229 [Monilinia laxa]|uniref:Uncharacterized protein n=1 Tax=Monilinia laxa TaxID=61186 RepID=A0A5N6KKY4_MONLA|nr:hypothetical protein EYC80_005229 [Monilinia laxa]